MRKKHQCDIWITQRVLSFSLCAPGVVLTFRLRHISQVVCYIFFPFRVFCFCSLKHRNEFGFPHVFYCCFELACWATWETLGHLAMLRVTSHPDNSRFDTHKTSSAKLHSLYTRVSMAAVSCCRLSPFPALHCGITMALQHVFSQFWVT